MEKETKVEAIIVAILSIAISLTQYKISLALLIYAPLSGFIIYYLLIKPIYNSIKEYNWKTIKTEDEELAELARETKEKKRLEEETSERLLGEEEIIDNPKPREKEEDGVNEL